MGPTIQKDKKNHPLFYSVRLRATLFKAWASVRENGLKSTSLQTRNEVKEFAKSAETTIVGISDRLRKRTFRFEAARGVLISKKNKKSKRPVVIAPIVSRVVQRAILDVIQTVPAVKAVLHAGYNFGGIDGKGFGVPNAVAKALACTQQSGYYIRTDIKSFFTAVPRQRALAELAKHTHDVAFNGLLKKATDTELADAQRFGKDLQLFPLGDLGVAQGSSISPLLCNFLLKDFDVAMNGRNVTCIRYIDDFILFAPNKASAFKAFKNGLRMLSDLGLDAYDPNSENSDERVKADHGSTLEELTFLGCDIRRDRVRPSDDNCKSLLKSIENTFDEALAGFADKSSWPKGRYTYASTLAEVGNQVRGWGKTFSFCSDDQLMRNIDIQLTSLFNKFNDKVKRRLQHLSDIDRRRYLGFLCLEDCLDAPEINAPPESVRALTNAYKNAVKLSSESVG